MTTEQELKKTDLFYIRNPFNMTIGSINKKELMQLAIKNLKGFHKIGIDKELLIKDLKGKYSLLNSYVYLLNIGFTIEIQKEKKRIYCPYVTKKEIFKE